MAAGADYSGSAEAAQRLRARALPKGSLETPAQKLERLRMEAAELADSIEAAQKDGALASAQYPAGAREELGELAAKLNGIARAMSVEAPVLEAMQVPPRSPQTQLLALDTPQRHRGIDQQLPPPLCPRSQGSTADKIMADLSTYSAGAKGAQGAEGSAPGNGSMTYELYLEKGSAGVALDKVSELERRLAALEHATGSGQSELSQDLSTIVSQLSAKVALLDKGAISKVSTTCPYRGRANATRG